MSSLLVENKQQNKEGEETHRKVKVCFQGGRSTNLPAGLTSVVSFLNEYLYCYITGLRRRAVCGPYPPTSHGFYC